MAPKAIGNCLDSVSKFFLQFLEQSGVHGFKYIGSQVLHIIEKYFRICLIKDYVEKIAMNNNISEFF